MSFCCTVLLLNCTFHQYLDWDKQNIQSQLQKIVKNFPVPIVQNSFDCWELPWHKIWWQFPLLNFHGNSFKLSIFDIEGQNCVLFLYNLYFFAKSIDVLLRVHAWLWPLYVSRWTYSEKSSRVIESKISLFFCLIEKS